MTRKAYIDGIEGLRVAILKLCAEHAVLVATDAQGIEDERHKKTAKLFDALELRLYEDGAISRRIQDDNRASGRGEQYDLFDKPEKEAEYANADIERRNAEKANANGKVVAK